VGKYLLTERWISDGEPAFSPTFVTVEAARIGEGATERTRTHL
jgi:hypothetical protein